MRTIYGLGRFHLACTPQHDDALRHAGICRQLMDQSAQTALSNGRGKLEQRMARWLCMAHDRLHSDELPLTHEYLAIMLGVQRPGVTLALQEIERRGAIAQRRSFIRIVDRTELEVLASDYVKLC